MHVFILSACPSAHQAYGLQVGQQAEICEFDVIHDHQIPAHMSLTSDIIVPIAIFP